VLTDVPIARLRPSHRATRLLDPVADTARVDSATVQNARRRSRRARSEAVNAASSRGAMPRYR
jgi:hypothetical protein